MDFWVIEGKKGDQVYENMTWATIFSTSASSSRPTSWENNCRNRISYFCAPTKITRPIHSARAGETQCGLQPDQTSINCLPASSYQEEGHKYRWWHGATADLDFGLGTWLLSVNNKIAWYHTTSFFFRWRTDGAGERDVFIFLRHSSCHVPFYKRRWK